MQTFRTLASKFSPACVSADQYMRCSSHYRSVQTYRAQASNRPVDNLTCRSSRSAQARPAPGWFAPERPPLHLQVALEVVGLRRCAHLCTVVAPKRGDCDVEHARYPQLRNCRSRPTELQCDIVLSMPQIIHVFAVWVRDETICMLAWGSHGCPQDCTHLCRDVIPAPSVDSTASRVSNRIETCLDNEHVHVCMPTSHTILETIAIAYALH